MLESRAIHLTPTHARFAIGYACTCTWAIVLLFSPAFGMPSANNAAVASMLPGLVACLGSIVFFKSIPPFSGHNPLVAAASLLMSIGTLLCTFPAATALSVVRTGGLTLSGFCAIVVVMAWFETFTKQAPRAIVALSGCAVSIAACACWAVLACPQETASILASALPLVSFALLPRNDIAHHATYDGKSTWTKSADGTKTVLQVIRAAVPLRTLAGLAITFFIVRSIATLAPEYELFSAEVSPLSLVAPIGITAFFIASAMLARRIDPSILYKILLSCFAGCVFLLAFSTGVTAALVFYANIVAEVITWTVLALWAKKTPVRPHLVFAIGWIAECIGNTSGQAIMPLFMEHEQAFFALAIMLILVAVGFAFSEGKLTLDVDFEDEDRPLNFGTARKANETSETAAREERRNSGGEGASPQEEATAEDQGDTASCNVDCRPIRSSCKIDSVPQSDEEKIDIERDTPGIDPMERFAEKYGISPRERDVLAFWLAGRGMKFIENTLFISESTVKSHLRSIYRKCNTHNRDETISLFEKETSGKTQ